MDNKQDTRGMDETILNPPDSSRGSRSGEDAHTSFSLAGDSATLTVQASSSIARKEELATRAGELLLSVASDGLEGEVHIVTSPSSSHVSAIGDSAKSHEPLSDPSLAVGEATESLRGNSMALASDAAGPTTISSAEGVEDKARTLVIAGLRTIVFVYISKLPIVGSYFVNKRPAGEPNVGALATETTPLLDTLRDPKTLATKQAEGFLRFLLSPLLGCLPDVDALDNMESDNCGLFFKIFVECYVLARDGGGWLFTYLQEHSLVIAPTVSLGHLSSTDLAASTIGTAVASVTGYSIIQGLTSSVDKVLASAPNRRIVNIACAQAAVVTGIVLFPITNLWAVQSAALFQWLGQPPEVAAPASQFLRITAAGLPGYAISEIAKRYLTSQGLSSVHTSILSITAPLNLVLNYLLVNGPIPTIRLGFAGAPLCTVLSHNALAIMLIVYIVQRAIREEVEYLRGLNTVPDEPVGANGNSSRPTSGNPVTESPQDHSEATFFTGLGTLIFAGITGVLKNASQLWSKDFGGVIASLLGPNALATQAVLLTTATTLYQAPRALGSASSQRTKKWMTKGNVQRAKIASAVAFAGTLGVVTAVSNVLLAFATSWGRLFNNDPVIVRSVSALLPVIAIFQVVYGVGAWVDSSLGALGKTAVFPSVNASGDYILGIPLGVYLSLLGGWGLSGLWVGLTISLACSCLVATIVLVKADWKNAASGRGENAPRGEDETHPTIEPSDLGASM